ncbi:MAG TPA: acyl-CoA synthetase FdrA [Alphaproteobacteria bacterium]
MSHVVNRVRRGLYLDSLALMRISQTLSGLPGVETASLMIGTPANRQILDDAGMLAAAGHEAGANDLIIAIKAESETAAKEALAQVDKRLDQPQAMTATGERRPRTIAAAANALGGANLAIISVPGEFAANEARKALAAGLHVLLFSDNVAVEDERALKQEAQKRGLLLMGPDCGTALIGGTPLAFANEVASGDIGIVSASGTGLQEVSCLIARAGGGVSHGIGVGGRDLSDKVGGLTTLMAIEALDRDPGTRHIVLISKPPSAAVAAKVLERVARSTKPFTICFLGAADQRLPANAKAARTLAAAASLALGRPVEVAIDAAAMVRLVAREMDPKRRSIRGIYSGGTLCAEAQLVLREAGEAFWSNAPVPGAASSRPGGGHVLIDYGADEYTVGRPHPMIDPTRRNEALREALADPLVAVVLIDVVIGYGAHDDPAGAVAAVAAAAKIPRPAIVASVTGTDGDPQNRTAQIGKLEKAGILVAASNAQAAALALAISRR